MISDWLLKKAYEDRDINIRRADGRIEWICEHNVGHTVYVPKEQADKEAYWYHGCDGCCVEPVPVSPES